jgi:RNA polymerase sigma factor (sigma-70 family)
MTAARRAERSATMAGIRPERSARPPVFEDFFRDTYARLVRALLALTGDRSEAEELAQEALARAFERWERVRVMASAEGYVFRTALNLHRMSWRRSVVRRRLAPSTSEVDPIVATERREDLSRALRSLSHGQRAALFLVEWFGLGTEEAARVLGVRPTAIRVRLHRARTKLRERLGGSDE